MAQIITRLAIFFLLINLSTGMVMSSQISDDLQINTQVTGDEEVDESKDKAEDVSSGNSGDESLFGLYTTVSTGVSTILDVMTAGPAMLAQLGVPNAITDVFKIVIGVVYALGIASFLRGFNLL